METEESKKVKFEDGVVEPEAAVVPIEADDDDDDEEEEVEEEEGDESDFSEDETPTRDAAVPVENFLMDCSYEAIQVLNCDFLSDFGAAEPFLIDGDSLVSYAIANPYVDWKCGQQMLHVIHVVESTLLRLMERGAIFDVFFFEGNAVLWRELGAAAELARMVVLQHFQLSNHQLHLRGEKPAVQLHILPGSWWDSGRTAFSALVEQLGPAFIMTDFGWSGVEQGKVLNVTRAFVNHLHLSNLHVVTLEDFEVDGSHTNSNNMQPPRHPKARGKIASALQELVQANLSWLAANQSDRILPIPKSVDGHDIRDMILLSAMQTAATSEGIGKGNFVAMCTSLAIAKLLPLTARCFPFTDESFQKWKSASSAAKNADTFLDKLRGSIVGILSNPETPALLKSAVKKDTPVTIADIIDGRLFSIVLACMGSGNLEFSEQVILEADKYLALVLPGVGGITAAAGRYLKLNAADTEACSEFVKDVNTAASSMKIEASKPLVPIPVEEEGLEQGKHLLHVVLGDVATRTRDNEDSTFAHHKIVLGEYRDRRYKDVEPVGDEPDALTYKVGSDNVEVMKKANKWNNASRQAQLKARYSSAYIDSLLEGTPLKRQVIPQGTSFSDEDFKRRKTTATERLEAEAEQERRAQRRGGAKGKEPAGKESDGKDKGGGKGGKGGKGQQSSGTAKNIIEQNQKRKLEEKEKAKAAQLEHVKKNAPRDLLTDPHALLKHLEELKVCASQCAKDGVLSIALDAEMAALSHIVEAIKRDRKDDVLVSRHVKRGFVVIQRLLVSCRPFVTGERAERVAEIAAALGFPDLSAAIEGIAKESGEGEGKDKEKDKKEKKDKDKKSDKKDDKEKSKEKDEKRLKKSFGFQVPEQSAIRYQVELASEHLRRPAGVEGDERVSFKPDDWQRRLLDIVDCGDSALVVAPTASGKTFIAYYVMEMCLRANDDDVVVYVAPTSALADQVYHEVQARYTKKYKSDSEHLTGIFNTSYRENHLECQILVAEPQCLELLLMDPAHAEWAKGIRHIIFDEVHSIGMSGGDVWERMLLYSDAPFLGLSATLGNVERFRSWLERLEEKRNRKLHFVNYTERHNDLCPYMWTDREAVEHQIVGLHPCWATVKKLVPDQRWAFPSDFKLLPEHCVRLYDAIAKVDSSPETKELAPANYFQRVPDPTFNISMRDARDWEIEIKKHFCVLSYETQNKVLSQIVKDSEDACAHVEKQLDDISERRYLQQYMLPMVRSLAKADMLPCIVFHMTRDSCVKFAKSICKQLRKEEEIEQEKDGHADKVLKQQKKMEGMEKMLEKMGWSRDKGDEEPSEDQKEMLQALEQARQKLEKLRSVDPRFALIPPGQSLLSIDEINEMVSTGRRKFFEPKNPLHQALLRGVAAHHAGMPRKYKMAVERLFRMKRLSVVIATETLAMGINMPTKTSVFAGDSVFLNAMNYRQMAGRAGRRGFDLRGNVVFMGLRRDKVQRLMNSELPSLQGNLLLTGTNALKMLIKHASIRSKQEYDVILQKKRFEEKVDIVDEHVREILKDWRTKKDIVVDEDSANKLARLSVAERKSAILEDKQHLEHVHSRDLVYVLVEIPEAQRGDIFRLTDGPSKSRTEWVTQSLNNLKLAAAALKNLRELEAKAANKNIIAGTEADKERIRVRQLRSSNAAACSRIVNNPLFCPAGALMSQQCAHGFRFIAEYLQKESLLDDNAAPRDLACIIANLSFVEPSNFAAVNLLRSRLMEGLCVPGDRPEAEMIHHLVVTFAHLFGTVKLPRWHAEYIKAKKDQLGPCSLILPPLDPRLREVLRVHNDSVISACVDYWRAFVRSYAAELEEGNALCLSRQAWPSARAAAAPSGALAGLSITTDLRSPFAALSGRGDRGCDYGSLKELCSTLRAGLFIDNMLVPTFEVSDAPINAYLVDFWTSPGRLSDYKRLLRHNKISENYCWQYLKNFALALKALQKSLDRRYKYAPYKQGIHGEGRDRHTVFSDPQVQSVMEKVSGDYGDKFRQIAADQDS